MPALVASLSSVPASCPEVAHGETAADCPWADLARRLIAEADVGGDVERLLALTSPALHRQLLADHRAKAILGLWGRSLNRDENAGDRIIDPRLLDACTRLAGVTRNGDVVHAGVAHTYGYLLSLLATPYGFKRSRYVHNTMEARLGLPKGLFGPTPAQGTLLQNFTWFLAHIALADRDGIHTVLAATPDVAPALKGYDFSRLVVRRLVERALVEAGEVELRTDIVTFPMPAPDGEPRFLLIYSLREPSAPQAHLVTAFPVDSAFADTLLAPNRMGDRVKIKARFNAHVPELGREPTPSWGARRVEVRSLNNLAAGNAPRLNAPPPR